MIDFDNIIYVFVVFFAVLLLSRLINYVLGIYLFDSRLESEFWTFVISFLIDSVLMYAMVRYESSEPVPETISLVSVKAFPFILFYVLGVGMFDCCVAQIVSFKFPPWL